MKFKKTYRNNIKGVKCRPKYDAEMFEYVKMALNDVLIV